MNIYYYNRDEFPVVSVSLIIPYGGVNDPSQKAGLAHLVEHMVFRGTQHYNDAPNFIRKVYEYGGDINAITSYHSTIYTITLPPRYLSFAIELLFELVFNTKLNHFKTEKAIILQEKKTIQSDYEKTILEDMNKIIFTNTPYQFPIGGTQKSITNIKEKDVKQFYHQYYHINKSNLFIVGKISLTIPTLSKYISQNLIRVTQNKQQDKWRCDFHINNIKTYLLRNKQSVLSLKPRKFIRGKTVNNIYWKAGTFIKDSNTNGRALVASAFVFNNFTSIYEDAVIRILAVILGGNMISRMYGLIREKHQLAYSTDSAVGYFTGIAVVYSLVDNNSTDVYQVIKLMKNIYHDIAQNGVTSKEFNVAREYLYGDIKRSEQDSFALTLSLWNSFQILGSFTDAKQFRAVLDSITLQQYNNQIKKILTPNNLIFSVLRHR